MVFYFNRTGGYYVFYAISLHITIVFEVGCTFCSIITPVCSTFSSEETSKNMEEFEMQYSMFDKGQEFGTDGLVYSKGG